MNASRLFFCAANKLLWVVMAAVMMRPMTAVAATEDTFDVLQIGTRVYTNVTVTTKAKDYIFILHAAGMTNIKLTDLSPELQKKLGYDFSPKTNTVINNATAWAKAGVARIEGQKVKEFRDRLTKRWQADQSAGKPAMGSMLSLLPMTFLLAFLGVLLLLYLFHCFCFMLICRKAGEEPGVLVWLPIVQLFPLLRAAKMSGWWFVAWFVPLLNLVAQVLWCLNIAKARGKNIWAGILLALPVTGPFAFMYLAFSAGLAPVQEEKREPEVMSLQVA